MNGAEENYWKRWAERRLSRRRAIKLLGAAGAAVASGSLLSACNSSTTPETKATTPPSTASTAVSGSPAATPAGTPVPKIQRGGILKVANPAVEGNFEPNFSRTSYEWLINFSIYETLTKNDAQGKVLPGLAESWTVGDKTITLKLRKGVKFHDGTDFNAAAVKFNYDRIMTMEKKSRVYGQWEVVQSLDVVDDSTVKLNLKRQYVPLLGDFAQPAGMMVSPTAVQKLGDDIRLKPVGAGPFQAVEVIQDDHVTLKKFDGYWNKELPYLDGIEFKIIPDEAARLANLKSGAVDLVHLPIPAADVASVRASKELRIVATKATSFTDDRLNVGKPPFNNPDLLKAYGYAIDREAIVKGVFFGDHTPATGVIGPGSWAFDPSFVGYTYDPAKAKELLKKGGAPDGFEFTQLTETSGWVNQVAQAIKDQVAKVGIKVNIEIAQTGKDYYWTGEFQARNAWSPQYTSDPDSIFRSNYYKTGIYNYHNYKNPKLDDLIDQAAAIEDIEKRRPMYWEMQRILFESGCPRMMVTFRPEMHAMSAKIQDYFIAPDGNGRLHSIWLAK